MDLAKSTANTEKKINITDMKASKTGWISEETTVTIVPAALVIPNTMNRPVIIIKYFHITSIVFKPLSSLEIPSSRRSDRTLHMIMEIEATAFRITKKGSFIGIHLAE